MEMLFFASRKEMFLLLVSSVTMRLSNFINVICFLCQTDSHMRILS